MGGVRDLGGCGVWGVGDLVLSGGDGGVVVGLELGSVLGFRLRFWYG